MSTLSLLFPGQGSQEPGMGRDAAEHDRECMDLWKKAERISGLPLREIYWDSSDDAAMAATQNLQPALTVVNLALWKQLAAKVRPCCAAGHSLGEYSALAAAHVLPEDTVLELVALRGRLMSEADPEGKGAMAAVVKLAPQQVEDCILKAREATGEILLVANYNTPGQFVVSGTRAAVAKMQELVKAEKGRAIPLPVSGAFHSPLMNEAAAELKKAIGGIDSSKWNNARFPVFTNASAKACSESAMLKEQLEVQMTSSVYWVDTICGQWDAGARVFLECGPKGVLGKMVDPILSAHGPAKAMGDSPAWSVCGVGSLERALEFSL